MNIIDCTIDFDVRKCCRYLLRSQSLNWIVCQRNAACVQFSSACISINLRATCFGFGLPPESADWSKRKRTRNNETRINIQREKDFWCKNVIDRDMEPSNLLFLIVNISSKEQKRISDGRKEDEQSAQRHSVDRKLESAISQMGFYWIGSRRFTNPRDSSTQVCVRM